MRIRPERKDDAEAVRAVVAAAFGRQEEADLVEAIRDGDGYVAELSLVAEEDGEIVGHIMLSRVHLDRPDGTTTPVLCLAPLAVRPDRQRQDIGGELTREALDRAEADAGGLVVVTGHPDYYPRFGFEGARSMGLEPPDPALPDEVWMARRLRSAGATSGGRIRYPAAFGIAD